MNAAADELPVSRIAAAIAEPARTRMLYCLMDGRARTSTELAVVAEISPSTASVHLARLKDQGLVKVRSQGRCRYYSLENPRVAAALEALTVLAGSVRAPFRPSTPPQLRLARTCYDHMAGTVAVELLDKLLEQDWLVSRSAETYELTSRGEAGLAEIGIDATTARSERRRFACACLDWSERRPHLAGSLGAALLQAALRRRWLLKELDSRALRLTPAGRRALRVRFDLQLPPDGAGHHH